MSEGAETGQVAEATFQIDFPGWESQKRTRDYLVSALEQGRFPQSVLLEGQEGIGKKKLMLDLAALLRCEDAQHKPCGKCYGCTILRQNPASHLWALPLRMRKDEWESADKWKGQMDEMAHQIVEDPWSPDVVPRGKEISVHMIRALKKEILRYKQQHPLVILIPEADLMHAPSANALLKVLEEVPPNCYFLLSTAFPGRLLPTIRSRCLSVHVHSLHEEEIAKGLADLSEDSGPDLKAVARVSTGSLGRAVIFLRQGYSNLRKLALEYLELAFAGQTGAMLQWVESQDALNDRDQSQMFLDVCSLLFEDLLLLHSQQSARNVDIQEKLRQMIPPGFTPAVAGRFLEKAQEGRHRIQRYCQPVNVLGALGIMLGER